MPYNPEMTTIQIHKDTRKRLMFLKVSMEKKAYDDVIDILISSYFGMGAHQ